MADASSTEVLSTLVPVVIGGVIALAGTWLAPWISERHKETTQRKKKRADKFEELVAAIFEVDHWLDNLRQTDAFGREFASAVSPFWKLHAISAVYFPEFEGEIVELDLATSQYRLWITEAGQRRLARQVDKINDGFKDAYTPYSQKRDELLKAIKEFAAKEFKSVRFMSPVVLAHLGAQRTSALARRVFSRRTSYL
jgi:hypothetical protein